MAAIAALEIPIRLAEAAERSNLLLSTLRSEAKRGTLTTWRVAGKDYTSLEEIRKMFERCRVPAKEQDSGFGQPEHDQTVVTTQPRGLSETMADNMALVAARESVRMLKERSPSILRKNTHRQGANVRSTK